MNAAYRPEIVAHRGASGHAPENTLPAFRLALAMGARTLEMDVRLTRDGHPAVIHDATVDRTTDGQGLVAEYDLHDLQRLNAGARHSEEYAGMRIPTLGEVFATLPEDVRYFVELKEDPRSPEALVRAVLEAVAAAGARARVRLISSREELLAAARAADPDIALGALEGADAARMLAIAGRYRCVAAMPSVRLATPDVGEAVRAAGLRLAVWTANLPADFERAWAARADEVITDYPERAAAWQPEDGARA